MVVITLKGIVKFHLSNNNSPRNYLLMGFNMEYLTSSMMYLGKNI